MEQEISKIDLPNIKIIVTGNGRVGKGIMEIMRRSRIKEVSVDEFLYQEYNEAVFVHLNTMDYNERIDGSLSKKHQYYSNPELYRSSFVKFAIRADIFIAGHYHASGSPYFFSNAL